jgi:hypothetical protein
LKRRQPGPVGDDLAARLVAGDHALVAFGPFAEMLVIDAANVGAADGGGLHAQQNFAVARRGTGTVRISTVELPGRNAAVMWLLSFHQ